MALKIVISDPKENKAKQLEVSEDLVRSLIGKKVGDTLSGKSIGIDESYEVQITGGSDDAGFPMRKDVMASGRRKIFAVSGVGLKPSRDGMRKRKTVAGTMVSTQTAQINVKITKHGKQSLFSEPAAEQTPAE